MWMRAEQLRYCERAVFAQSVSACNGCRGFAAIVARGPPLPVLARCACCGPLTTDLPAVLPLFSRRLCLADGPPASGAVRAREVGTRGAYRLVSPRVSARLMPRAAAQVLAPCTLTPLPPPPPLSGFTPSGPPTSVDTPLFVVEETSDCCCRVCCAPHHPFLAKIYHAMPPQEGRTVCGRYVGSVLVQRVHTTDKAPSAPLPLNPLAFPRHPPGHPPPTCGGAASRATLMRLLLQVHGAGHAARQEPAARDDPGTRRVLHQVARLLGTVPTLLPFLPTGYAGLGGEEGRGQGWDGAVGGQPLKASHPLSPLDNRFAHQCAPRRCRSTQATWTGSRGSFRTR